MTIFVFKKKKFHSTDEESDLSHPGDEASAPILPVGRNGPWDIHSLLGDCGIRSPLLSIVEARRLVLQEKALFLSISRSDKGVYLRSVELHDQLII